MRCGWEMELIFVFWVNIQTDTLPTLPETNSQFTPGKSRSEDDNSFWEAIFSGATLAFQRICFGSTSIADPLPAIKVSWGLPMSDWNIYTQKRHSLHHTACANKSFSNFYGQFYQGEENSSRTKKHPHTYYYLLFWFNDWMSTDVLCSCLWNCRYLWCPYFILSPLPSLCLYMKTWFVYQIATYVFQLD